MKLNSLNAVSPIDGRYINITRILNKYFSEFAFIYNRLKVEIFWLISLSNNKKINMIPNDDNFKFYLKKILNNFNESEAKKIKYYENIICHDVKAIEYYLKDKLEQSEQFKNYVSFIHIFCTSEDINNIAYSLMIKESIKKVIYPNLKNIINNITILGKKYGNVSMISRTHGQPATPTTMGKELINFVARLQYSKKKLKNINISAKCNGTVGNYNAHILTYPKVNWIKHCKKFINSFGLIFNTYTTQIEPHDNLSEIFQIMIRINNILLDYTQDMWSYISMNYFIQKSENKEVGSSIMPHKINPIDFENAEGNLGLSNALLNHFVNKLTKSRLQRDLSDSTVLRNIGTAFSYSIIAYSSIIKGNKKIRINLIALKKDLEKNWIILSEAIQTIMRKYKIYNSYEKLKFLTRGKTINRKQLKQIIQSLTIPKKIKIKLMHLTPDQYIGLASKLVRDYSLI